MICVGASAVPSAVSIAVFSSAAVVTSVLLLTVTRQVADFSRAVAVMVAVPSATAVTSPSLLTVATEVLSLLHTTDSAVTRSGTMVGTSVSVAPDFRVRVS